MAHPEADAGWEFSMFRPRIAKMGVKMEQVKIASICEA
jgi:hypothetical protein